VTMYSFVDYKYKRGGYRVWDPKRRVVIESRDGLLSPTLNDLPPRPVDEDESVKQSVLDHSIKPTTPPDAANAPALSPPSAATPTALPEVTHQPVSAPIPHPRITVRLPGCGMNRPADQLHLPRELRMSPQTSTRMRRTRTRTTDPTRVPTHLRVLSTTFVRTKLPFKVDALRPLSQWRGGNSAMLILDEAAHHPVTFSNGLPGGIQLSQLPDPRSVRGAGVPRCRWIEGRYGPGAGNPQVARRL